MRRPRRQLFDWLVDVVESLQAAGLPHRMLFLEASEDTLMNRFKETRRRHPLAPESSIAHGHRGRARAMLDPIRQRAEVVIDTTDINAADLRRRIADELLPRAVEQRLAVTFLSFGYKHGAPRDADLPLDVRFLPNPHYVPELRPLTGLDERVVEYVGRDGRWTTSTRGWRRCWTSSCPPTWRRARRT